MHFSQINNHDMKKSLFLIFSLVFSAILFVGCNNSALYGGFGGDFGEPEIRVFNTATNATSVYDLEDYVAGVVAGEVYNNWEDEALKVQAILARTFALKYIEENPDIYKEKGISTNIADAQNYDESTINTKIKDAVSATRGVVLMNNNKLINAYFHSNSGGKTTTPESAFGASSNMDFIKPTTSPENENNSKNYSWTHTFSKAEMLSALNKLGLSVANVSSVGLGKKDESGRCLNLIIGGKEVGATALRSALGSTKMRSTLLSSATVSGDNITFSGIGYGHGVGVSQWGAQILAKEGKTYQEIFNYYFNNILLEKIY